MTITIPKEKLESWKAIRGRNDIKELRRITKLSKSGIYYVLSTGKCSSKKIASQVIGFHEKLEKDIQELTQRLEQEA